MQVASFGSRKLRQLLHKVHHQDVVTIQGISWSLTQVLVSWAASPGQTFAPPAVKVRQPPSSLCAAPRPTTEVVPADPSKEQNAFFPLNKHIHRSTDLPTVHPLMTALHPFQQKSQHDLLKTEHPSNSPCLSRFPTTDFNPFHTPPSAGKTGYPPSGCSPAPRVRRRRGRHIWVRTNGL